MNRMRVLVFGMLGMLATGSQGEAQIPPAVASRLKVYNTPHYVIHSDIAEADLREADLRMTRMFEEYRARTAGFAGQPMGQFPFYLFKNPNDYYASGAIKDSDGVFIIDRYGSRLMAIAGEKTTDMTWHVVQHEGFHQFAASVIKEELPIWVNEGLAEYFGEAVWTGDSFICGVIPPDRLKEVDVAILRKTFKPFDVMMTMSREEWGSHLDYANYTQAWAMVQFLAHGDEGKYLRAFIAFMNNLNRGMQATDAWNAVFGKDTRAFEARFEKWWLGLPQNPTRDLYMRAAVATMTSYFARATLQKQTFTDVAEFIKDVKLPDLKAGRDVWLPPKLFAEVTPVVDRVGAWTIGTAKGKLPTIVCTDEDGTKYVGSFTLGVNKVNQVNVAVTPPKTGSTDQK